MALFWSSKRNLALQKNRELIAVKLSRGDKNSFIRLSAPLKYLNKYCKFCENFAAGGAIGILDSFYVTIELWTNIFNFNIALYFTKHYVIAKHNCERGRAVA